jgi:hypothetical protein
LNYVYISFLSYIYKLFLSYVYKLFLNYVYKSFLIMLKSVDISDFVANISSHTQLYLELPIV